MRKVLSIFVAVCLILSLFTGVFASVPSARANTSGDYQYTVAGSNATITGYTGAGGAVVIPDTLDGYPVVGIGVTSTGHGAFHDCTTLTSVTIGNGVISIGNLAFTHCTALISVIIPDSVTSIGIQAFSLCGALTSVIIPNSVTSIGEQVFYYCTTLTSVTIGNGVTSIGDQAFADCFGLTSAYFLGNAPTGTSHMFHPCAPGFTVHYVTGTTGWANPWYGYPTTTVENTTKPPTVLVLHVGSSTFAMNGVSKTLDSPPVIKNGRTLVPIRAIIEALAGTVGWDAITKKATVTLGKKTIALWIGKSVATVNGVSTPIDSTNAKVVPEIINGRTMLPLRFVTENLGATVDWDQNTQTITITYTP